MKTESRITLLLSITVIILLIVSTDNANEHRQQWWIDYIGVTSEYDTHANIKVAIIDTGINTQHKDLEKANINNIYIMDGCYSSDIDSRSHGTGIAGVIAAHPYNRNGVQGLAEHADIISICVVGDKCIDEENIIKGIYKAIDEDVDIINLSVGTNTDIKGLKDAVQSAYEHNILVVAAVGNELSDRCMYPAAYDGVLRVGCVSRKGNIVMSKKLPTVYAPGEDIATLDVQNGYRSMSGSSIACGIMTGIAARIMSEEKYTAQNFLDFFYSDRFQENSIIKDVNTIKREMKEYIYEEKGKMYTSCTSDSSMLEFDLSGICRIGSAD